MLAAQSLCYDSASEGLAALQVHLARRTMTSQERECAEWALGELSLAVEHDGLEGMRANRFGYLTLLICMALGCPPNYFREGNGKLDGEVEPEGANRSRQQRRADARQRAKQLTVAAT